MGIMSVRNSYNTVASFGLNPPITSWWHKRIWRWNLPPKNKCFLWLCLQNKILTWPNIQRRGFSGPGMCILCRAAEEELHHLFIHCRYVKAVWMLFQDWFQVPDFLCGFDLLDCLHLWFSKSGNQSLLPLFMITGIWRTRNLGIFEDSLPSVESTTCKVLFQWNAQPIAMRNIKTRRITFPRLEEGIIHGFFDDASQQGICGAGVFFSIHQNHNIKITVSLGSENGLKAEIMELRCLLWFARRRGFLSLIIYGDSQVTVNWFNENHNISAITLEP